MNTTTNELGKDVSALANTAAQTAEGARRLAQQGVSRVADGVNEVRAQTGTAFKHLAHDTEQLAQHSKEALREGVDHLRERSLRTRDSAATYIQHEPMKSVLIAAAVGATLMGLLTLLNRPHHH
ncbi:MAG TPA: hypothetical protein VFY22_01310 [Hydrogenophaga sp.]|nr:hypothetical protein [Hydrogenophaga sp.]